MARQPREDSFRDRLYAAYSSTHAGVTSEGSGVLSFRRDVLPHLPQDRGASVIDLGCGQGFVVKMLLEAGYARASGIDISPEQVELAHRSGIPQVRLGDYREGLGGVGLDAVVATDFFEHLTKPEVLEALDRVHGELRSGGVLVMRVPNSASPFVGSIRYGDLTHETSFTSRSVRQAAVAAGFAAVSVYPCAPSVHGARSLLRRVVWTVASCAMKMVLAAETGQVGGHLVTSNIVAVMRKA